MAPHRLEVMSPYLISGSGAILFLIAVVHHIFEFYTLNELTGPLIAVLLDGLPALGLVYAGYRLSGTDLPPEGCWRALIWCFVGGSLFVAAMGASLFVRMFERGVIVEPLFPLLIAAETGAIGGVIAGYYTSRAQVENRRAQTLSNALGFVNSLIRHDLRNDLSVIRGHANLLKAEDASAGIDTESNSTSIIIEKTDEALDRIETTGAITNTLVGDADFERINLGNTTAEMVDSFEKTYDVSVTTDISAHAPVTADTGLRSVIDNLLENAVEHNDADEPQVHVEVKTDTETVTLSVADDGPGISDKQKKLLFNTHNEETASGGLSLVQTLVEGYGGQVWVEDDDPRGSVFILELPRAEIE